MTQEPGRIYEQYDLGDNELLAINATKESVCFDLHEILNNDDGFKDGFELSWKEIYYYCKEGMQAEEIARMARERKA